jgi:hypothetical protein
MYQLAPFRLSEELARLARRTQTSCHAALDMATCAALRRVMHRRCRPAANEAPSHGRACQSKVWLSIGARFGSVSGHDFSRAVKAQTRSGFSPCCCCFLLESRVKLANATNLDRKPGTQSEQAKPILSRRRNIPAGAGESLTSPPK